MILNFFYKKIEDHSKIADFRGKVAVSVLWNKLNE